MRNQKKSTSTKLTSTNQTNYDTINASAQLSKPEKYYKREEITDELLTSQYNTLFGSEESYDTESSNEEQDPVAKSYVINKRLQRAGIIDDHNDAKSVDGVTTVLLQSKNVTYPPCIKCYTNPATCKLDNCICKYPNIICKSCYKNESITRCPGECKKSTRKSKTDLVAKMIVSLLVVDANTRGLENKLSSPKLQFLSLFSDKHKKLLEIKEKDREDSISKRKELMLHQKKRITSLLKERKTKLVIPKSLIKKNATEFVADALNLYGDESLSDKCYEDIKFVILGQGY